MFLVKLVTNILIRITLFILNCNCNKIILVSLTVLYLYPVKCLYPLQKEYLTKNKQYILFPKPGDIPLLNRKIMRGSRVSITEHPYVVSIRRQISHYLTGTLLSHNLVITVAHPLDGVNIKELGVVLGENYSDRGRAEMTVILVILHQDFDMSTLKADIALLRFFEIMPNEPAVMPTKIIKNSLFIDEYKAHGFVVGWGRCEVTGHEFCMPRSTIYYPDEFQDPMLKAIKVTILERDLALASTGCQTYSMQDVVIDEGMCCVTVSHSQPVEEVCMAVPGAPLTVNGQLYGVQSWGFGCGYPYDSPIIYTNVSYYYDWIHEIMKTMKNIIPEDFVVLYEATKAAKIIDWMSKTRLSKIQISFDKKELQPWPIDYYLAKLDSNIFDVRDFVDNLKYQQAKNKMYRNLRYEYLKKVEYESEDDDTTDAYNATSTIKEVKIDDMINIYNLIFGITSTTENVLLEDITVDYD